jgi:molybdate transport system substrate-binding protein
LSSFFKWYLSALKAYCKLISMSRLQNIFGLLLAGTLLLGCSTPPQDESGTLVVAAASDLAKVGPVLQVAFRRVTGYEVTFSYGASGQLAEQIRRGAPFDVYLPAARSYCEALERDALIEGRCEAYALGRLVAWSRELALQSLDELAQEDGLRIALANPQYAPYGQAAQQALERAGVWNAVQPRVVFADSVSHAFQMAKTGNADVALVAIALIKDEGGNSLAVDPALHEPIEQMAAIVRSSAKIVRSSAKKEAARALVDFLTGLESRRILETYGFGHP